MAAPLTWPARSVTAGRAPLDPARARVGLVAVAGMAVVGGYVALLSWTMRNYGYDVWGGYVLAPVLYVASLPLLVRAGRRAGDRRIARLMLIGLAVKLCCAPLRYVTTSELYGGVGDAHAYHLTGAQLAPLFRHGTFSGWQGHVPGTGFIEILTGAIYSIVGTTELGGYVVFSWLGFWGLYWFYRAFCVAVPDGNRVRYAALVFLLPSLLFWPSSIGKEAWMILVLGITAYGAARVLTRGTGGFAVLFVGLAGIGIARPHLLLIVVGALAMAYLARPHSGRTMLAPLGKGVGLLVFAALLIVSIGQARQFFQAESAPTVSLGQALDTAQARTEKGGSQFTASPVTNPVDFPQAAVTVLYRPFFFEAGNGQALATALDGTIMIALTIASWRQLRGVFRRARSQPFLVFALVYVVLFVIAFSRFANFGILARERVQVTPLLLVLVCLPAVRRRRPGDAVRSTNAMPRVSA